MRLDSRGPVVAGCRGIHERRGIIVRAFAFAFLTSLAAIAAAPAVAQTSNDTYAFCYADPPTYRTGEFVFTQVRFVGTGVIDLGEVGSALTGTSPQVRGRQIHCWRYPNEQIAESRRQDGMSRERARGYTVLESAWTPTRVSNAPVMAPPPVVNAPGATITATPVADAATQPAAPLPPVSADVPASSVAAEIDRAIGQPAAAAPAVAAAPPSQPAPPPQPAPDTQQGAVANLNAGVVAREAARLDAAAQVQAAYQRQLEEHARQVAEIRARNEKAQADYQAAVAACAAGDFSKCGGPPVTIKKKD